MRKHITYLGFLFFGVGIGYLISTGSENNSSLRICFTPAQRCQPRIVSALQQANSEILVQAYSLTAKPIIRELALARKRGVHVRVIGDAKTNNTKYIQPIKNIYFKDRLSGLAHNKIIIIDKKLVFTGSYNFSNAAEYRNAENLIEINNPKVVDMYRKNWNLHCTRARGCND